MKFRKSLLAGVMISFCATSYSAEVQITMNDISTTMSLAAKDSGRIVETGSPAGKTYSFDAAPGEYTLTAYSGSTVNGTIDLIVENKTEKQEFSVFTVTAYATNSGWTYGNDYEIDATVADIAGRRQMITLGDAATAGRKTFLTFKGNSYNVAFIPSESRKSEGYTTGYKSATVTSNSTVSIAIPTASDFTITVPEEATVNLGIKFTHFTPFTPIEAKNIKREGGNAVYTFNLANSQVYNYRATMQGKLTHAGYFTMNSDEAKRPEITISREDFEKHDPKDINYSVKSNSGYETGDIFVNINPEGHLKLKIGENFDAHAMRTWEITDNVTNNYFIEPDFHYTVLNLDGSPSVGILEVEDTPGSPWANLKALSKGTVLVLVSYDGINVNFYSGKDKKEYTGGEYWGAIWPENTAVFVVTVGENDAAVKPNMVINEDYNEEAKKNAGKYVDAEHDVFYYLDCEPGFAYNFKPENVSKVEIAYPVISDNRTTYTGFSTTGVTLEADGSYTVLLRHGRQILKLTDASGASAYQVLTAKKCHREISNATREGSKIFQPGDKVKIQYSGLYHPANKLAGIYNMSAYVTYNGTPNGTSLIQSANQYTFGSSDAAQAVTVEIQSNLDAVASPQLKMDKGVIQVNGFGDPIGNHRIISKTAGRSPNFTALSHKTYFGALPDVTLDITPYQTFRIKLDNIPENGSAQLAFDGKTLTRDADGYYEGTYGTYSLTAQADGYRNYRATFTIGDDAEGLITFAAAMEPLNGAWDGKTAEQPALKDGKYMIYKPTELAWFAQNVNSKGTIQNASVENDLHLGNFDWTPIGNSSSAAFKGHFEGNGHTIAGLYINNASNNMGLFGYINGAEIEGVTVDGFVSAKQYVGGLAGYAAGASKFDRCANLAEVTGSKTHTGGLVGYLYAATGQITNSYNAGSVTGTTNCGGVVGLTNKDSVIENIFNVGEVNGTKVAACVGGTAAKNNVRNAYSIFEYDITDSQTTVSRLQMQSGEVAYLLGEAFGQTLGIDNYPVFDGLTVYYDAANERYYNIVEATELRMDVTELTIDIKNAPVVEISATHGPDYSVAPEVVWSSSDEKTVSVEHHGELNATLTALQPGDAFITVALKDKPEIKDSCHVIVATPSGITEIFGNDNNLAIDVYDTQGRVIMTDAKTSDLKSLVSGLYIIRLGDEEHKIIIK